MRLSVTVSTAAIATALLASLATGCGAAGNGSATPEQNRIVTTPTTTPSSMSGSTPEPVPNQDVTLGTGSGPHRRLTDRRWKLIARDPESHQGERYIVYCVVTQSDAATGDENALADCGGRRRYPSYGYVDYPTNTILASDLGRLKKIAEDDLVTIKATVLGSIDYETQIGGNTTAPALEVDAIRITGQQEG